MNLLKIHRKRAIVREITAPPADSAVAIARRQDRLRLAAEISAHGHAADVAASCARLGGVEPFPPQRPPSLDDDE